VLCFGLTKNKKIAIITTLNFNTLPMANIIVSENQYQYLTPVRLIFAFARYLGLWTKLLT
jgi:hypothetical protein